MIMMGKTHGLAGLTVAAGAACIAKANNCDFTLTENIIFFSACIMGSYLPDADEEHSTVSRKLGIFLFPFFIIRKVFAVLSKIPGGVGKVFGKIAKILRHRYLFHSVVFWILMLALYSQICYMIPLTREYCFMLAAGLSLGILSHLLLDMITGSIAILTPVTLKRVGFGLFSTNSVWELVFRLFMLALSILLMIRYMNIQSLF